MSLGEYEAAIADYNLVLQLNPQDVYVFYNRGLAYLGTEEYEAAIADFDRAIQLNSKDADAFLARGDAYYGSGEYQSAIADHQQYLKLLPDAPNRTEVEAFIERLQREPVPKVPPKVKTTD
jgi:regulator of sirC expression with transglutaminase-like and TPR domain